MERNRWLLVVGVGLIVFMVQLDASIVTVALPAIQSDFHTTPSVSEWVVLGYLLPVIALLLPSGRWLDGVGKRRALVAATAGFALASVVAGAAPGIISLIGARIAQGVCCAVLLALAPALSAAAVRREAIGRAMGIVTTLGPLGAVSGPAIGGIVVDTFGWQWIFWVNVPVSLVVVAITMREMRPDGGLHLPDRSWARETGLLAAGAGALFVGLSLAAGHGPAWALIVVLAVPPLIAWRRLPSSGAVRDLLAVPTMAGPHLALLGAFTATGVVAFLAPFYLQDVLHAGGAVTGLTVLAFPLAMAAMGTVSGVLADRWGSWSTAVTGIVVITAGLLLLVPLGASWTVVDVAWRLAVIGVGVGLFNASAMTMTMSSAPRHLLGTTAASTGVARQLGLALGPALATSAWALSGYALGGMRAAMGLATMAAVLGAVALVRMRRAGVGGEEELPPPAIRPSLEPQPSGVG
jgi:MFS family permease